MRQALVEAERGGEANEVPIGAVVVIDGEIVGRAHNTPVALSDRPRMPRCWRFVKRRARPANYAAERHALRDAGAVPMCCGAALNARIARVVYGAPDPSGGGRVAVPAARRPAPEPSRRGSSGVLADESATLLRGFFDRRRR